MSEIASPERNAGLICTVTTLWDSLANVQQFVSRNLAAGADHMFIFLDATAPDVREYLDELDTVTVVRTGHRYWHGRRPKNLNGRQMANANLVNHLLSPFDRVRWLFHIDGDESLDINRDELLSATAPAVRLAVLESASLCRWERPVDKFKRTPTSDELAELAERGVLQEPNLRLYFRGYIRGKVGVRPTLDLRLGIHEVRDRANNRVEAQGSPEWHVLHYDCWSSEEFLRKWASPMAIRHANVSGQRGRLRAAVDAILDDASIDDEERDRQLMEFYRVWIADDVDALDKVGLLVTPRPDHHAHQPGGLGADRDTVHRLLEHLVSAKRNYFVAPSRDARHPRELFEELRRSGSLDPELDHRVAAVLASPPVTPS